MYYNLIKSYIKYLKKSDVENYALKNSIELNNKEIDIIYNTIINDWEELYKTDGINILNKIKKEVREEIYLKIKEMYNNAKEKLL